MIDNPKGVIDEGDDVDLVVKLRKLWSHRLLLILTATVGASIGLLMALTAPTIYRANVIVIEVTDSSMSPGTALANQFGGLASLVGVNLEQGSQDAKPILQSRYLAEQFVRRNDIVAALSQKFEMPMTVWFVVKKFQERVVSIQDDKRNGTTSVSINWEDPAVAARWANEYVELANEILRTRAINEANRNIAYLKDQIDKTSVVEMQRSMYKLIESETKSLMLATGRAEYAFRIVDPAVPPEIRASPKRTLIVLAGFAFGLLAGAVFVLLRDAFARDPVRDRS